MRLEPTWHSKNPITQQKIDLDLLREEYIGQSIRKKIMLAMTTFEAIAERAFGTEKIATFLSGHIPNGYQDVQHFQRILKKEGFETDNRSRAALKEHLKMEVLAACSQLSIAFYFSEIEPDIAWNPLQEAVYHLGCAEGLAHLQLSKPTGASAGGAKKAKNAGIRRASIHKAITDLITSEMPQAGWTSIELAVLHIAPKLIETSKNRGLNLKNKVDTIVSEVLEIIDRDVVLKTYLEEILSKPRDTRR